MTTASWILQPAEFLQGQSGVPDFCHVDDLVAFKLHDVDVIGARASSRWWNRTTRARVRRVKHTVGRHVVSNCIGGERLDLVPSIRQNLGYTFHPIGVLFKRLDIKQRLCLCVSAWTSNPTNFILFTDRLLSPVALRFGLTDSQRNPRAANRSRSFHGDNQLRLSSAQSIRVR